MKPIVALYITVVVIIIISSIPAAAQWSEPVPVENINGIIHDFYPSISPDGQYMYFANGNRLKVSHWEGSNWSAPVDLGDLINGGQRQVKATVTPDNRTLYFTSWRTGGYGTYDVWRSEWQDSCECWGEPVVMPPPISTEDIDWDVQLSSDGLKMYISSDRNFSWGDLDIWCSEWNDNTQTWGEPYNLGLTVNSSGRDYSAYPTVDGNTIYFASWNPHHFEPPQWLGPVDLFVAYNTGNGWDSVDIMPPPITTGYWEQSPAISNDGSTLYFASNRPGGPGWTDIFVTQKTTPVTDSSRMKEKDGIEFNIYPNPSNSRFNFTVNNSGKSYRLAIYDITGRVVRTFQTDNPNISWNCTDSEGRRLGSGVYFAKFNYESTSITKKLLFLK